MACLDSWPCDPAYQAVAVKHLLAAQLSAVHQSNRWTQPAVVVAIAAVVVAIAVGAFVAWQAWLTRKATELSQDALRSSQSLAIDAARARLDQGAHQVEAYVSYARRLMDGKLQSPHARWNVPDDADQVLVIQAELRVANHSADRLSHCAAQGVQGVPGRDPEEIYLLPGVEVPLLLEAPMTVDQLLENADSRRAGQPLPYIYPAVVTCRDDRDMGVVDTWRFSLTAWLDPDPDDAGYGPEQYMYEIEVRPFKERTYWISQTQQIPLPDPAYIAPVAPAQKG